MRPDFETALGDLLNEYRPDTDLDEIISAFELKLYALREEAASEEGDE